MVAIKIAYESEFSIIMSYLIYFECIFLKSHQNVVF